MAEQLKQTVNTKSNRNWVRAAMSLKCFKEGFEPFVRKQVMGHHAEILRRLQVQDGISILRCEQCTSENLLPKHSKQKKCIQKNHKHCFCRQHINRRYCPFKICSALYDYIVQAHSTNDPLWINTNPSNWLTDYWELGKCFLNSPGYEDKRSAADTDATGLISIAINDVYIQDRMDTDIESLTEIKDFRNNILHSATCSIQDEEVAKNIDKMVRVLQDKKAFTSDADAQNAIQHLNELKNVQCHISFEDELEIRKETLKAIEEMTQDAVCRIRSTEANLKDELRDYIQEQRAMIKDLVQEEANKIKTSNVFDSYADNRKPGTEGASTTEDRRVSDFTHDKQQIQAALIDSYKQFYIKTDISPLLPEEKINVDRIYVPPQLYKTDSIDDHKDSQHHYYNIYGDVKTRLDESEFLANIVKRNILIAGDAGMGKTALCCRMMSAWCAAHDNSSPSPGQTRHDSTSLSFGPEEQNTISWCSYFLDIDFLFFISLKYCNDESTIEEMILKHLIDERYHYSLNRLLQYEGDKCLVILDDLNEWTPPRDTPESPTTSKGLPLKQLNSRYATIYTTRPWKLATVRPKSGEFDMIIELEGIDQKSSVNHINRVFQNLNKMTDHIRYARDFLVSLEEKSITHLKEYPLLSKFLLCLWFDESKLDNSLAGIYRAVIDLIIGQAHRKGALSHLDNCDYTTEHICDMMKISAGKEYVERYFYSVVLPLAVFSFHLCKLKRRICYVFETTNLNDYGLTEEKLRLFIKIGILSERICYGRSVLERCKAVSFVHETFQEFFASVYLSIFPNQILDTCKTAESILRMKPIFLFLSGLNFSALQIISYRTLSIIDNDENCQDFRCGKSSYLGFVIEMQRMISCCIEEARGSQVISGCLWLRDTYLGLSTEEYLSAICDIDFDELRSLSCDIQIPLYIQEKIVKAQNLDMLVCNNLVCEVSSVTTEKILTKNQNSLKCLKLSGKCLSGIEISANMFHQLRRLVLSDAKLECQQFTNLVTNSGCLEEVQLYNVSILDNEDGIYEEIPSDTLPYVSSIKTLKLRNCGHVFSLVSKFPCLQCLRFEESSPLLLCEILSKSTNLVTLKIREVNLGTDGSLAICVSKQTNLKLLCLQTVGLSQFRLSELLEVVGNLPSAARVQLKI